MPRPPSRLTAFISALRKSARRFTRPPVRDPYRLLLWEQVALGNDDSVRLTAFRLLETSVGTRPEQILAAPIASLKTVARAGGAAGVDIRAKRLRFIAQRALDRWSADMWLVTKLPYADALRELMRYPATGVPEAEKILLLCGVHKPLALDPNGVRVLLRLGYGRDLGRYDRTYGVVQSAAATETPATEPARIAAHFILRNHGAEVCVRGVPRCASCVLSARCPSSLLRPAGRSLRAR